MSKNHSKHSFEALFQKEYQALKYEELKEGFEEFCESNELFDSDYLAGGKICKSDFREHFTETAAFTLQDLFTEAFYEKNPRIYETAFEIFEENEGQKTDITELFENTYEESYGEVMNELFNQVISKKYGF